MCMMFWIRLLGFNIRKSKIQNPKFGFFVGALLFALCSVAEAQQSAKVSRIGYLRSGSARDGARYGQILRQGLRELGYVEGQHITIETRAADGRYERLPELAAELVRLPADVMVAGGTPAIRAAKHATSTIPIVMAVSTDPVGAGLVTSLARPGGNVTGLSLGTGEEFAGKWVELLKEAVPRVSRVGALRDSTADASILGPVVRETERAAQALGLKLHFLEARDGAELERVFAAMTSVGDKALIVLPSAGFNAQRKRIVDLAAARRLPAIYQHGEFVDAGGLMSYGPNLLALFHRAAYYVDRILKGAKPADLPVEQPTKFELVINLKTAKQIGLTIPPNVLARADRVIK
jgi:putative ABC transport system substrate-binding protein